MSSLFARFLGAVVLAAVVCSIPPVSRAQIVDWDKMRDIQPRTYVCREASVPPKIDGKLDDDAWQTASWTSDFVDIEGEHRPSPRFRTRAKMLWDQQNLYIAAQLDEPHVWGSITKHDAVIFHDNDFEVFIDPDGDHHQYAELELNALNTTWDLLLPRPYKDGGKADDAFELANLKSAVHVQGTLNNAADTDNGWTVEIAIPWISLTDLARHAGPPVEGEQWRVNFSRVQWQHQQADGKYQRVPGTREDNWVWSPQGIIDMHRPERWGYVQFSKADKSADEFQVATERIAHEVLMEVYHAQRSFFAQQNRWARTLAELEIIDSSHDESHEVTMHRTADGVQASVTIVNGEQTERWCIDQSSRFYRSPLDAQVQASLIRAEANRPQLEKALMETPVDQREAMEFLIANMPDRDLTELSAEYLLQNVRLAFQAWQAAPWKDEIPWDIFTNNILPYASINERRDHWRQNFMARFAPLIKEATTPSHAAALLNQRLFPLVGVKYSTKRPKADQSPLESMKAGLASCTGLSVLLIDACRALGIPARFVGTPLWSDNSGNHSWIEVWDNGWHFTGAAEPNGMDLDKAWFTERASKAIRDDHRHAIYAVSFQKTPVRFPLVWDRSIDYISAVNVTDRYVAINDKPPAGSVTVMFSARDSRDQSRKAATIRVFDQLERQVFEGVTKDEGFDTNDFLQTHLPIGADYRADLEFGAVTQSTRFQTHQDMPVIEFTAGTERISVDDLGIRKESPTAATPHSAVDQLKQYLAIPALDRPLLNEQPFARMPLSKADATQVTDILWQEHVAAIRADRAEEMENRELVLGDLRMPFDFTVFGEAPAGGRSLYISMHGGGGAPKRVNDRQWENQKRLYKPNEGIYLSPRAPTDTWNLWHQAHIDLFFDRLIENLIVLEDVNPDRVYLMGYSAGGDGVFQLAPRMADRLAAAAMMAGHPNETSPLGLRNLPFTLHMGELDSAYDRNKKAAEWQVKLKELQQADPQGYEHWVHIHKGKAHWMDREDAEAIPWMAARTRQPLPSRIVWKQDDVVRERFYWLAVDPMQINDRAEIVAERDGNEFSIATTSSERVSLLLNDELADLDKPIIVRVNGGEAQEVPALRTIATMARTLNQRGDRNQLFSAEIQLQISQQ